VLRVYIHVALGAGGPRWHPLNVAGRNALMARRQSESVQAGGMAVAAYSCNRRAAVSVWLPVSMVKDSKLCDSRIRITDSAILVLVLS
jgi:hypothetical protein